MQDYNITPGSLNLLQRIRYSIFPGTLRKLKDRASYRNFFNSLILHFRPRSVQERTLRFSLTWGLGGMAVVLVFMMFTTGLMLKFVYQPVPDRINRKSEEKTLIQLSPQERTQVLHPIRLPHL